MGSDIVTYLGSELLSVLNVQLVKRLNVLVHKGDGNEEHILEALGGKT